MKFEGIWQKARWRQAQSRPVKEMTARRSFEHSLGKFEPQDIDKPVAILTAWRGTLVDPAQQPYPEPERRRRNDAANRLLKANIRGRGLSFYPVVGAGQEQDEQGVITVKKENSLIVQPVGDIDVDDDVALLAANAAFITDIQQLLFNPTDEQGAGPFDHTQWGALVKFPKNPQAFLLHFAGNAQPTGPQDYTAMDQIGDSAEPRLHQEPEYTQMRFGPRAVPAMMDPFDQPGDVGNPRPGTGKPGAGLPGKRFRIENGGGKHELTS